MCFTQVLVTSMLQVAVLSLVFMFSETCDHLFMMVEYCMFYCEGMEERCCGYCRWLLWPGSLVVWSWNVQDFSYENKIEGNCST